MGWPDVPDGEGILCEWGVQPPRRWMYSAIAARARSNSGERSGSKSARRCWGSLMALQHRMDAAWRLAYPGAPQDPGATVKKAKPLPHRALFERFLLHFPFRLQIGGCRLCR